MLCRCHEAAACGGSRSRHNRVLSAVLRGFENRAQSRGPRTTRAVERMTMSVRLSAAAFVATLALAVCGRLYTVPDGQLLPSTAHAQSKPRTSQGQPAQKSPTEQLRSQVETLINRLRGRDMPKGIVKSNGRIEATQVDVGAKYPGRL